MKKLLIIKYGGSAITLKNQYETLNSNLLDICTDQIKDFYQQNFHHNTDIIIVHGAGSYGHFHAKQYGLKTGGTTTTTNNNNNDNNNDKNNDNNINQTFPPIENAWQYGLALTRQSVLKLNTFVIDSLISKHISATSISPFPTTRTYKQEHMLKQRTSMDRMKLLYNDGIMTPGSIDSIGFCLQQGILPVLHGDVVLDASQRCSILSGDHIILYLCTYFNNPSLNPNHSKNHNKIISLSKENLHVAVNNNDDNNIIDNAANNDNESPIDSKYLNEMLEYSEIRVVFLTDVQGVFNQAPHLAGAYLLPRIQVNPIDGSIDLQASTESAAHDVTGGIAAKLQTAIEIARQGVDVYIVQAGSTDAYETMLWKEPLIGTKITTKLETF